MTRKLWTSEVPCLAATSGLGVAEWAAVQRRFGLERMWRCGVCGRRVRRLYWRNERWACWRCQDLRYESCYRPYAKFKNQLVRLRQRLNPTGELLLVPKRPKGMHAATYIRLRDGIIRAFHEFEFHTLAALLKHARIE